IGFILTDGRARGIYQPCKRGRKPDGPPILKYYPAAVTKRQWLAARASISQRRRALGGRGHRPWSSEEDESVRELAAGNGSIGKLARGIGRTRAAVYQRLHSLGLTTKQNRLDDKNFVNVFSGLIRNARPPHDSYIV